jgi:hypothetical protein
LLPRLLAVLFAFSFLTASAVAAPAGMQLPPQPKLRPAGMPAGALMISPCVNTMGEHWANPKDLPFGPIYGTYKGQIVFTEVMIPQTAFAKGKGWSDVLKALPGHKIDHVDIWFEPAGHEGYPIPHYDLHAFYVSHATHMGYCPEGIKVPSTVER